MTPAIPRCSGCATEIPSDMPRGFCPKCLLSAGLDILEEHDVPDTDLTPLLSEPRQPLSVKFHSIGDYELLEEIARGGMGVVFRARQISLNRTVAVKVIQAHWMTSQAAVKRFHFEAEAAAGIAHPNIVPIYEVGEHDGHHYFSMKFVEGGSLAVKLSRHKPLGSVRAIAELVMKVARAIHFAHQHGIVHRDLKPGNILLDAEGEPHVTDFGLAMGLETDSTLTRSGEILGTPAYMSPEQAAGPGKITTAADIYSLGAILYELLTGHAPFCGTTAVDTLHQLVHAEPKRPRALNPALDLDLETICLCCLAKEPARRYPSADALAKDLENFLSYRPIQARPLGFAGRALKWSRRQPISAAAVVGSILIAVLGVGGIVWQWQRSEQHAAQERRHRERAEIATAQAQNALTQMEAVQLGRAEEFILAGDRVKALPYWALILRQNPSNQVAADRLLSSLTDRVWALLACPPLRHSNRVSSALFSRDGTRIVTAASDHTAAVWNAATGVRLCGPLQHDADLQYAELSADNRFVITASEDRTVRVWDTKTGAPVAQPLCFGAAATVAKFSPDGHHFAAVERQAKIHVGRILPPAIKEDFEFVTDADEGEFNADGGLFAGNSISGNVVVIDVVEGLIMARLSHPDRVRASVFHPHRGWIATACYDRMVRLWDLRSGKEIRAFANSGAVTTVEFSRDGQYMVCGDNSGLARVWDLDTGNLVGKPLRHSNSVRSAAFSPDGLQIITSSWDQTARIWNRTTGEPFSEPMVHPNPLFWAQLDSSGQRILTAGRGNAVSVWFIPNVGVRARDGFKMVQTVEFSPLGSHILISSSHGVEELDLELLQPIRSFSNTQPPAGLPARYIGNGSQLALYQSPGLIQFLETRSGQLIREIRTATNLVYFAVTPDLQWLITMNPQGVELLRLTTKDAVGASVSLPQPTPPRAAILSPDGQRLLVVATNGIAGIWNLGPSPRLQNVLQSETPIMTAAYSSDGRLIATTDDQKTLRIWDGKTGNPTGVSILLGFKAYQCLFSPDNRRLAVRVGDPVWLFDPIAGKLVAGPIAHAGLDGDSRIAFSPDGRKLVTSNRGTLHFWNADDGARIGESLELGSDSRFVAFHPSAELLLSVAADGTVSLRKFVSKPFITPAWLVAFAETLAGKKFGSDGRAIVLTTDDLWQVQQQMLSETRRDYLADWVRWRLPVANTSR